MMPPFPAGVSDVALFKERPNVAAGGASVVKQGVDIGVDACAGGGDDGVVMLTKFSGSNVRADGNVAEKSQLRGGSGVVLKLSVADKGAGVRSKRSMWMSGLLLMSFSARVMPM